MAERAITTGKNFKQFDKKFGLIILIAKQFDSFNKFAKQLECLPNRIILCQTVRMFANQNHSLPNRKIACQTVTLFAKQNNCLEHQTVFAKQIKCLPDKLIDLEEQKVSVKQINYLPIVWSIGKCLPNRLIICQTKQLFGGLESVCQTDSSFCQTK